MIEKGKGGSNTLTGIYFERKRNILSVIKKLPNYQVKGSIILYNKKEVARSYSKNFLYKFLNDKGINYKKHISKRLLPDEVLYVLVNNTLFIIEMKF